MKVKAKRITPERFERFGRVVGRPRGTPTSQAREYKFWSDLAHYLIEGETEVGVCTVYRRGRSAVATLERHLKTPEILVPIDAPFVLPVAREGDSAPGLQAFRVNVGEAVVIDTGVWHGACLPAGKRRSSYFVIFRRRTPGEDVEKKEIEPTEVRL